MSEWVIQTKLHPPVRLSNLVPRQRLLERMNQSFQSQLTLAHAPAGFGKSTCLAQWKDALKDSGIPVGWLSLDEYDADLFQFVTYLGESCRHAGIGDSDSFPRMPPEHSQLSSNELCGAFVTVISKHKGLCVLILDDFHRVQNKEVLEFMRQLLLAKPANLSLVICTREFPQKLSLADLRVHGKLLEITHEELRFTTEEIQEYLDYWSTKSDTRDWPVKVFERTEGWPVALQIVRRWLSDGRSMDETLYQLSGRSSDLIDYFLEQVFDSLSEEVRHFLMCTSILERVSGDLGGELCPGTDSWEVLDTLTQKDMFVQALDLEKGWYRYHRLFTEFLQERLSRRGRNVLSDLHQRAASWFMRNDYHSEALQHGMMSQNFVLCAKVLEALGGWHYALKGHVSSVQKVLDQLDDLELQHFPRLWLGKIYLAVRLGRMELGEREYNRFKQYHLQEEDYDRALMAEAQLISAVIDRYGDRPISRDSLDELEDLGNRLPIENSLLHAVRCNLLCALYRDTGQFEECMAIGDQAISHYREMGFVYTESFIYFHEGLACLRQARLRDAESLYREGFNIALDLFGEESDLAAIGRAFLAEVCYERNNLHEAKTHLSKAIPHIERADAWLDVYAAAYLTQIKLHWAEGNTQELERSISRAKSVAVNRGLDRLRRIVDLQVTELALKKAAWKQQEQVEPQKFDGIPALDVPSDEIGRPIACRIVARSYVAQRDFERAISYLEEKLKDAQTGQRVQYALSLSILLAVSLWLADRKERAITVFGSAVSTAIFEGNKRPFIDEGPLISGIIDEVSSGADNRRGNRLRDAFIAELSAELWSETAVEEHRAHVLSPREREVLIHVLKGRSNREIAEAIPLSVNTVKFHLKNVFEKLGVSSRKDAVSVAIRNRLV